MTTILTPRVWIETYGVRYSECERCRTMRPETHLTKVESTQTFICSDDQKWCATQALTHARGILPILSRA
jgi:hypothetical protein